MRPKLSKNADKALAILGRKSPPDCDLFERMVGQKITNLSTELETGNALIAELESQLTEAREKVTTQVGEFQGWGDALASYYASKAQQAKGEDGVPVSAPGGTMPGPNVDPKTTPEPTPEAPAPAAEEPQDEAPVTDKPQDEAPEPGPTGPDEAGTDATDPKAEPQG